MQVAATVQENGDVEQSLYLTVNQTGMETQRNISVLLFGDIQDFNAFFNENKVSCRTSGSVYTKITCITPPVPGTLRIDATVTGLTQQLDGGTHLSLPITFVNTVDVFTARIRLPPGATVTETPNDRFNTTSDGQHIILTYRDQSKEPADAIDLEATYQTNGAGSWLLTVLIAVLALALLWVLHRQRTPQYKTRLVIPLMKENERKVFDALLQEDGEAFQKELQTRTGYSKAQLSRLLNDLQERGLIEKERVGRTNKILLQDFYQQRLPQIKDAFPRQDQDGTDETESGSDNHPFTE